MPVGESGNLEDGGRFVEKCFEGEEGWGSADEKKKIEKDEEDSVKERVVG